MCQLTSSSVIFLHLRVPDNSLAVKTTCPLLSGVLSCSKCPSVDCRPVSVFFVRMFFDSIPNWPLCSPKLMTALRCIVDMEDTRLGKLQTT